MKKTVWRYPGVEAMSDEVMDALTKFDNAEGKDYILQGINDERWLFEKDENGKIHIWREEEEVKK